MSSDAKSNIAANICPVSHEARQVWLRNSTPSSSPSSPPSSSQKQSSTYFSLDQSRQISSIPRFHPDSSSTPSSSLSPNSESTSNPETSREGHWIYPSEQMFFDALLRKQQPSSSSSSQPSHESRSTIEKSSMRSVVPLHNAVNERTWKLVREWEHVPCLRQNCLTGPRLLSFSGEGKDKLTPRAWWNSNVLGYERPFDRHDWTVERCGQRVEYVIDFYTGRGKNQGKDRENGVSFYLDVRPKLNTWEGWRMRFNRLIGWT